MSEEWLAEPLVEMTDHALEIEQHVQVSNIRTRDAISVHRYDDGSIQISNRAGGAVQVPAHWLPIVNEFLVRSEVSA